MFNSLNISSQKPSATSASKLSQVIVILCLSGQLVPGSHMHAPTHSDKIKMYILKAVDYFFVIQHVLHE